MFELQVLSIRFCMLFSLCYSSNLAPKFKVYAHCAHCILFYLCMCLSCVHCACCTFCQCVWHAHFGFLILGKCFLFLGLKGSYKRNTSLLRNHASFINSQALQIYTHFPCWWPQEWWNWFKYQSSWMFENHKLFLHIWKGL